jgi:hypothetical protein
LPPTGNEVVQPDDATLEIGMAVIHSGVDYRDPDGGAL